MNFGKRAFSVAALATRLHELDADGRPAREIVMSPAVLAYIQDFARRNGSAWSGREILGVPIRIEDGTGVEWAVICGTNRDKKLDGFVGESWTDELTDLGSP